METRDSIKQLSMMIILTIITQIFLLMKGSIVASKFGVSTDLDAFNFASTIGSFVYSFIGAGISTILVPNLADPQKKKAINIFISVFYTTALILLGIMLIFRNGIITVLSGSDNNQFITVGSEIFIATLIASFLNSFLTLVSGVLQYNGQFNRLKLVTLITSIILVIMLLVENNLSIYYYSVLLLITTCINITMHLFFLVKCGFKYNIDFDIKDNNFKKMIRLFIPTLLSDGIYQISLIIDSMIAARMGVGQISILNYANTVIGMVNVLFLANVTAYMYPRLIRGARENKSQEILTNYIIYINALMFFLVILFAVLGRVGISILYQRGNFRADDTNIVYICALIFIISLPTNAIRDLIYKYFYINNDTFTPFKNSIVISGLNISISLILSKYIGLYGVILGTVIASYFSLALIIIKFKKKFGFKFNQAYFIKENIKLIITTLLTVSIFFGLKNYFIIENRIFEIIIYGILMCVVFGCLLMITRSKIMGVLSGNKKVQLFVRQRFTKDIEGG